MIQSVPEIKLQPAPSVTLKAIVPGISLTDSEAEMLAAIVTFVSIKGFPPTIRELATLRKLSYHSPVSQVLKSLEEKDCLSKRIRYTERTIQVIVPVKLEVEVKENDREQK